MADLPFMNPYDWILLFNIVAKDVTKYEPIFNHLKRMLKCYILEIGKTNIEIASILNNRPIMKPFEEPEDIQDLPSGVIDEEYRSIVYKKKEGGVLKNCKFFLRDKHSYSTNEMNQILVRVNAKKTNSASDLKCVSDMIQWYLAVRATLLKNIA
ncbi:unnamed protein product [Lactuca saligna]|uniref:Uncharacterized protein n=1 Tax=Lactuca saligna TaxID=75948 RepID=A0AA36EI80_LACSI|nr:unnamed protein product [Lactuca saligna]